MEKFKHICFLHMQRLTNFPFIEADFDALTNYELLCKVVEYLNKVIANENEQNESINELANAFNSLKTYVDNYFENLDVQEEINNKLDDMAEAGTLQEIIGEYLNANAIWGFNNISAMKSSSNLINGSYATTLGYHSINDGGGATYKIRNINNEDVVDEALIIALEDENLIAELITNNISNVKQFGAYGDGTHDDTNVIKKAINYCYSLENAKLYNNIKLYIPKGKYLITDTLTLTSSTLSSSEYSNIQIEGDGEGSSVLIFDMSTDKDALYINASSKLSLRNLSLKNISDTSVKVDGVVLDGDPMMMDITNVFVFKFYRGFYSTSCVANFTNCWANSCKCGFNLSGTGNTISNCYASQSTLFDENDPRDFEGCGYYIKSSYSNYISCASDSNVTAYKIVGRNSVTLQSCGAEGNSNNVIIDSNYTSTNATILIDNFGLVTAGDNRVFCDIRNAKKVVIKDTLLSLESFKILVADNLPSNVLELSNCNAYVGNQSQYIECLLPLDNRSRKNGVIYNFDGKENEGKCRIYKEELNSSIQFRMNKSGVGNGTEGIASFRIRNYRVRSGSPKTRDELLAFYFSHGTGTSISEGVGQFNGDLFTIVKDRTDENWLYYTITWTGSDFNTGVVVDVDILTNQIIDLNSASAVKFIEIGDIDYTVTS